MDHREGGKSEDLDGMGYSCAWLQGRPGCRIDAVYPKSQVPTRGHRYIDIVDC